jgi:alkaline phosphatase
VRFEKWKGAIVALFTVVALGGTTAVSAQIEQPEDTFQDDAEPSVRDQAAQLAAEAREAAELGREGRAGNVIFIHPDGAGANHYGAGRIYWEGPDGSSSWDRLPEMAVYRGHMEDVLTGTSNGGATTHAFGFKVQGPGSYGKDGNSEDEPPSDREILSLSGYPGSIMREAGNAGKPIGVVNDGDSAEPGTGAFLAEVGNRDDANEINRQIIQGRPGFDDEDVDPWVVLGGGEANYFPKGTAICGAEPRPDCAVHAPAEEPETTTAGARSDGLNLVQEAIDEGYTVIRTRAEFDDLRARLELDPHYAPKVLGLFADEDIFNDVPEEELIAEGLVNSSVPEDDKRSRLVLYGSRPGTAGYNPPRAPEMNEVALEILDRRAKEVGEHFLLVSEIESTDNFGNNNNAIGTLVALQDTFGVIEAAQRYQERRDPRTLIMTAADSDAGGMQIVATTAQEAPDTVDTVGVNPTGVDEEGVEAPVDGLYGRGTEPFRAAPDQFGQELPFAISWIGTPDVSGGIVSRAQGLNANLLRTSFSERFDNIDVYRMMYLTLFDEALPYPTGRQAPDRG